MTLVRVGVGRSLRNVVGGKETISILQPNLFLKKSVNFTDIILATNGF
jgi:hypothetical protein